MSTDQAYHIVTMILALGTVIGPLFFGYLVFKLTQIFVTKTEFMEYKVRADGDRREMNEQLSRIGIDVTELLQRTADRRIHRD